MTDRQENKLSMYLAVKNVTDKHNSVWSSLPAFVTAYEQFLSIVQEIQDTRMVQEGETTGVTQDKAQAKENAISKALEVSTAVYAYASATKNNTLREKVDYSPSELRRSRDTILIDRLEVIHEEADNVIGDLGDYGIDAADLTELKNLIGVYSDLVQEPRAAISNRADATAALDKLFTSGDDVLNNQMDKLMEQFGGSQFYTQYFNARIIIDLGGGAGTGSENTTTNS